MKKTLITQQFINEIKNYKEYSFKRYFIPLLGGLIIAVSVNMMLINIFHFTHNNAVIIISVFAGLVFMVPFMCFFKEKDTPYSEMNYHIAEDVLLSKFLGDIKKPFSQRAFIAAKRATMETLGPLGSYQGYVLRFLHSGDFVLPYKDYNNNYFKDSTIYDFAQREDRFYVLVDSNNVIKEIFDTRLFDISTDDFELIENKYYPKKGKRS